MAGQIIELRSVRNRGAGWSPIDSRGAENTGPLKGWSLRRRTKNVQKNSALAYPLLDVSRPRNWNFADIVFRDSESFRENMNILQSKVCAESEIESCKLIYIVRRDFRPDDLRRY